MQSGHLSRILAEITHSILLFMIEAANLPWPGTEINNSTARKTNCRKK
jgi:hypothetical protein